ncbi:MAG: hypothetical protein J5744_05560, partial [Oscillospiraceae bacterium]|nr:hypothetical protein [Oscillospiraceae bacterium]
MKRFVKVLFTSILCICLFVVISPNTAFAADVNSITTAIQEAGITDPSFAKAVANSLLAKGDEYKDDSLYTTPE